MAYCGSYLPVGGYLSTNDYISSPNDLFCLVMQSDGNLCVYEGSHPIFGAPLVWMSGETGPAGDYFALMQSDGNFCVYAGTGPVPFGVALWCSMVTAGGGTFFATIQGDGNFCVYEGRLPDEAGPLVWNTGIKPPVSNPGQALLGTGAILGTGQYIVSDNNLFFTIMQGDGNLCTYQGSGPTTQGQLVWQSGPTGPGGQFFAAMQTDGNLCVYADAGPVPSGSALWCTMALGAGGQFFAIIQGDGNLCVYAGTSPVNQGALIWNSGIKGPWLTPAKKLQQLACYAPVVWLAQDEEYFPCSTDWSFQFLIRYANPGEDGKYCLKTIQPLSSPSDDSLPSFKGDLASAKVYAFWVEKSGGNHDLIYFFYFGYDRGKEAINTIWGSHVGDWEHLTVRLNANLQPVKVYMSQHADGEVAGWWEINKAAGAGNRVVIYCAWGSHGLYKTGGDHDYGPLNMFTDACSEGTRWETTAALETFDYNARNGLGSSTWPRWMDTDYTTPGASPEIPASNTIYRWGNPKEGASAFGESQLNDGPTGPPDKGDCWNPDVFG